MSQLKKTESSRQELSEKLGGGRTPITKVHTELPVNLYVKREELLPFSFGGNKVRIAEEFYNDMENQGKTWEWIVFLFLVMVIWRWS